MKKIILSLVLLLIVQVAFCQSKPDSGKKIISKTFTNYNDLKKQQAEDHVTKLRYVDSLFNYDVAIPSWLNIAESNSRYIFWGGLPPINGIENIISIKAFPKKAYPDLQAFKNYIIGDWAFGTHPKWSNNYICYGLTELDSIPGLGRVYRASRRRTDNMMFTCKYLLVETKSAFLWIDFTSTPDTFEPNTEKFDEFLKSFKTTNF